MFNPLTSPIVSAGRRPRAAGRRSWPALLPLIVAALVVGGTHSAAPAQAAADCSGSPFRDVCPDAWFYASVMDLYHAGILSGYQDGTFRPYNGITRAQYAKVMVLATGADAADPPSPIFADVPAGSAFYHVISVAATRGWIAGYTCGGPGEPCDSRRRPYFRPGAAVTRGQVAKIMALAYDWQDRLPHTSTFVDVPSPSPFFAYVERAYAEGALTGYQCGSAGEPCNGGQDPYFRPNAGSTRAQVSKIVSNTIHPVGTPVTYPTNTPPPGATATSRPPNATATSRPPGGTATPRPPTATATPRPPSPTPPPPGQCPILPADSIWNRNVSAVPTAASSSAYIARLGGSGTILHPGFGACCWQGQNIGQPFVAVQNQPLVPIHFTAYGQQSDPGPYPIPTDAPIEGCQTCGGDRHVLVEDLDTCTLYEMYHAYPQADGSWNADQGSIFHLTSNALRPDGWTSADAAGLPIYPGLVRYDEVQAGAIHHAIRFTAPDDAVSHSWIWPARHSDGQGSGSDALPMGSRLRLKASVDISGYSQQVQVILQALKDYGMILADTDGSGGQIDIDGLADDRWSNSTLHALEQLHASDFEAVDVSGLMIDPNSGQSR